MGLLDGSLLAASIPASAKKTASWFPWIANFCSTGVEKPGALRKWWCMVAGEGG